VHVREGSRRSWGLDDSALTGAPLDPRLEADEEGELIIRAWDEAAYRARVEEALLLLKDGRLEKVVLARMSTIQFSRSFRLYEALHAMEGQPNAFSICWSPDGARFFLSATPERLGRVHEGQFETMALAGTLTRQDGRSVEDLLSDAKERTEHNYVVEMICSAAADFASEVGIRDVRVLELPHVTHILTRIGGRMHAGCSLRHVIAALHPTPAVAGTPRPAAQELITRLEPFDRGLYAGCVGWYIGESEGDAAVTIRSALVSGREALVWAGAGIVGESDARAEERETRAKLQTMLDILGSAC
jgi:isochorismate synthase